MRVKVFYREILHASEHTAAELGKKALRDISHKLRICEHRKYRKHVKAHKSDDLRCNECARGFPVAAYGVIADYLYDFLQKERGDRRDNSRKHDADRCYHDKSGIAFVKKLYHTTEDLGICLRTVCLCLHVRLTVFHRRLLLSSVEYKYRGRYRSVT